MVYEDLGEFIEVENKIESHRKCLIRTSTWKFSGVDNFGSVFDPCLFINASTNYTECTSVLRNKRKNIIRIRKALSDIHTGQIMSEQRENLLSKLFLKIICVVKRSRTVTRRHICLQRTPQPKHNIIDYSWKSRAYITNRYSIFFLKQEMLDKLNQWTTNNYSCLMLLLMFVMAIMIAIALIKIVKETGICPDSRVFGRYYTGLCHCESDGK